MSIRHSRPSERWPQDQPRRFVVGSVTGHPISGDTSPSRTTHAPSYRPPRTTWYVHDAAFGYRIVATFYEHRYRLSDHYDGHIHRRRHGESAEQAARRYARALRERYLAETAA